MEDSTPTEIVTRQDRQRAALRKAIPSINDCGVFGHALDEYIDANTVSRTVDDHPGVLYPPASLIDRAARTMVSAIADYHCVRVLFAAQQALNDLDCEGGVTDGKRIRR
jgi:hypothetical protein